MILYMEYCLFWAVNVLHYLFTYFHHPETNYVKFDFKPFFEICLKVQLPILWWWNYELSGYP